MNRSEKDILFLREIDKVLLEEEEQITKQKEWLEDDFRNLGKTAVDPEAA
jgi:hypothetical protein